MGLTSPSATIKKSTTISRPTVEKTLMTSSNTSSDSSETSRAPMSWTLCSTSTEEKVPLMKPLTSLSSSSSTTLTPENSRWNTLSSTRRGLMIASVEITASSKSGLKNSAVAKDVLRAQKVREEEIKIKSEL